MVDCRERTITIMGVGRKKEILAISDDGEDWQAPVVRFFEEESWGAKKEIETLERKHVYNIEWMSIGVALGRV